MMNDRAYVLTEKGASRLDFHSQWTYKEAPKRGLRDPWAHRPDRPIRYEEVVSKIAGIEIKGEQPIYNEYTDEEMLAWKAERDEYMRQRNEWVALQMFHKYGYEAFLEETTDLSEKFRKSVFPCESHSEPQCNIFCSIFNDCAIRAEEKGDEKQ